MSSLRWLPSRHASTALLLVIVSTMTLACGDSPSAPASARHSAPHSAPPQVPTTPPPSQTLAAPTLVPMLTYEGSGEAVHPDGAITPPGWGSTTAHVVATPYPGGQARFENPSYYDVLSPFVWLPPTSGLNPLVSASVSAHLSDPDMVYDPDTRQLSVYYREVTDTNRIYLIRSLDGAHWDKPVLVLAVPNHLAISPSVVRRGRGDWLMWTVNGGTTGCSAAATTIDLRHSANGLVWSPPEPVQIGTNGETPWHIDVEWIPSRGEFWGVYNGKVAGSCMTRVVRFATSPDGSTWSVAPSPLLSAGAIPAFADVVYRSSIAYDAASDVVTLLYSGARAVDSVYTWQVASEQIDLKTLLARTAATPQPVAARALIAPTRTAPDLTNETAP